ncbi:unnamed protein product [Cunninghamella blakesleeana]
MYLNKSYISLFILLSQCIHDIQGSPHQVTFRWPSLIIDTIESTPQYGRFLHLTDIHIDDHYEPSATIKSFCHRDPKKNKEEKERKGKLSGYWGAPATECDAAPELVYHTLNTIANEWKDKIDFIIWTGDNARHDTEPDKIRRLGEEILHYNIRMTELLQRIFVRADGTSIPLIPCLGNNDVHPHNKLRGPGRWEDNTQLIIYSKIWSDLIPQDQVTTFRHGGYFKADVAPGIRVLSLNTLYFSNNNDYVGECKEIDEPGWDHMRWFENQLKEARQKKMKVYIMGHIPPTTKTFKTGCLHEYSNIALDYKDIIQAHLYGHMNMDHFQILHRYIEKEDNNNADDNDGDNDDNDDDDDDENSWNGYYGDDHDVVIRGNNIARKLRKQYKRSLKKYDVENDLTFIHVAPPILPVYNPAFRVNEYNKDTNSPNYGTWTKYTQWYSNLSYWNDEYVKDNTTKPVFEIEYETDKDYNMPDLSLASWLNFTRLITKKKASSNSKWGEYLKNLVVRT